MVHIDHGHQSNTELRQWHDFVYVCDLLVLVDLVDAVLFSTSSVIPSSSKVKMLDSSYDKVSHKKN